MKYLAPILMMILIIGGCDDGGGGGPVGNAPPTLQFYSSQTIGATQWAAIPFSASDPDSMATISFFYDDDNRGFDGALAGSGIQETDSNGTFSWDVNAVADGLYFIYGIIYDGVNAPVTSSYSPAPVIVSTSSSIPPYVRYETPMGTQQGNVTIDYDLWEATGDFLNVFVEYRGGSVGSAWAPATAIGVVTNAPGGQHWLVWQSDVDEPGISSNDYQLRIWAEFMNSGVTGPPYESGIFTVNN